MSWRIRLRNGNIIPISTNPYGFCIPLRWNSMSKPVHDCIGHGMNCFWVKICYFWPIRSAKKEFMDPKTGHLGIWLTSYLIFGSLPIITEACGLRTLQMSPCSDAKAYSLDKVPRYKTVGSSSPLRMPLPFIARAIKFSSFVNGGMEPLQMEPIWSSFIPSKQLSNCVLSNIIS